MSWNIELAFVRTADAALLEDIVPDVFEPTNNMIGWEDATSVMRDPDLSATWHDGWAIVIDVNARLSSLESFWSEASSHGELFIFRVSEFPIALHSKHGRVLERLEGNEAFLIALGREQTPSADGELLAWDLMQSRTGVRLDDLWGVKFRVFNIA
jgi:hypothetical protein